MEYTKGEWLNHEVIIESKVMDNAYKSIALIVATGNNEEMTANAHLIAAAPDMYEALKQISEGKGRYSMDRLTHAENTIEDMRELALKALAKAEGNQRKGKGL